MSREINAVYMTVALWFSVRACSVTRACQVGMYCFSLSTDLSLAEIANIYGRKSHTTAIHAIRQVEARCMKSEPYRHEVSMLLERCRTAARLARELAA